MKRILSTIDEKLFIFGVFLFSLTLRVVLRVVFLDNQPSAINPDEGTYRSLAEFAYQNKDLNQFPGFDLSPYAASKSLILPSELQIHLGILPLEAVRNTSMAYGLSSILLFYLLLKRFLNGKSVTALRLSTIVFAIWPSFVGWSLFGLRETTSIFWTLAVFYFSKAYFDSNSWSMRLLAAGGVTISFTLAFGARPETALLLFVTSFVWLITPKKRLTLINFAFSIALLFAFLAGTSFTSNSKLSSLSAENNQLGTSSGGTSSGGTSSGGTSSGGVKPSESYSNPLLSKIDFLQNSISSRILGASASRATKRVGAQSALEEINCPNFVREYPLICEALLLPVRMFQTMFLPLFGFDESRNWQILLAATENYLWLLMICTMLYLVAIKGFRIPRELFPFIAFAFAFWASSSLLQGNLGTAFRHKSIVLPSFVLIATVLLVFTSEKSKRHFAKN